MSNDLASQQLSMPSNQMGQLEPTTNTLDSSIQMELMGSGTTGSLQQMSVSNMQVGPVGSGYTGSVSQQMSVSNMQMGMLHPLSNNFGSQMIPITNQQTRQMEPHTYNLVSQQFFLPNKQLGELGTMPNNVALQQLSSLNKRKTMMDPMSNYSVPQKSSLSNKRVAQAEHRPWLQQMSTSDRAVQMQFMTSSPGSQHLPSPNNKKVVKKESVPSKSGPLKQSAPKIQNAPMQPSPKGQTESFESVRSKMRESLAAALALVSQEQDSPSNAEKNSQNEPESSPGKIQENSPPAGSAFTASDALEPLSRESKEPSQDNSSAPMCLQGQSASQENFANGNTTDNIQTSNCDGESFRYTNLLPEEDVSFSDNFFARDELLQGNGLSWVLEPVIAVEEIKEIPTAVGQELGNLKVEGVGDGQEQPSESPEILAFKIEAELFKLFGGVNKKYKEKGRSLLFNLKDRSNPELRERVMSGEISPERLCAMTAEELASKELSEWRMAKAEEFAQMVVLPDSDGDMRRLVKKTHKGEFQVEVEQVDAASADVSVGGSSGSSLVRSSPSKVNEKDAPPPSNVDGKKGESKTASADKKSDIKDEGNSCTITIPSHEGSDLMQGLMLDNDELKDTEFLPPIVSLDEFMESLDTEPPFENLPVDADKLTPVSDKDDSLIVSESKSPVQSVPDPGTISSKPDNVDVTNTKPDADMKPGKSPVKSETAPSAFASMGELVWDGQLQLNISSTVPAIGIYKSGEKTSAKVWVNFLEIKGRVRLDAFEKFLQELPMSRSRAVMIVHFVGKEALPKSELGSISEVAESYVSDERVGFAEPGPGFELYFCPPHKRTIDMLGKILPIGQLEALNAIDNGLIGVVVWRKAQLTSTISPNSASHHKHSSKKQHFSSSRRQYQDKDTNMNVNRTTKSAVSHGRPPVFAKQPTPVVDDHHDDHDGLDDDDVPPGFGPGREDDDLPEFNFTGGSTQSIPRAPRMVPLQSHPQTPSRPVEQIRELIFKYGQSQPQPQGPTSSDKRGVGVAMQPPSSWNDDEDDIPEWQPQAPPQNQPPPHPVHGFQTPHGQYMVNQQQIGLMQSHQQYPPTVMQGHGQQNAPHTWPQGQATHWAAPPPAGAQLNGAQYYVQQPGVVAWRQDSPKSRGF
ncbi:hypothetical protein Ddye_007639 [Dipteronia dyeriana]|uniref:TFIIS central domain-containing protein n=1 Tax=Dipteronia dyeriana TaxID=168575 RepID=A0AAE0CRV7_9ROSI|nr:hypothetical protein Ddye_007639 [Dipteronia dyeriana]